MDAIFTSDINTAAPPIRWQFSFRPFLEFTEQQIGEATNKHYRHVLEYVAGVIRSNPALLEPTADLSRMQQYDEIIDLIHLSQATNYSDSREPVFGIGIMNPFQFISHSERFREILLTHEEHCAFEQESGLMLDDHMRQLYKEILSSCYCMEGCGELPPQMIMKIAQPGAVVHHYHLQVNTRFVRMKAAGELPPLRQEWIDFANGVIETHDELSEKLDLSRFIAEGFLIFRIVEATDEEALASLSGTIANMHTVPVGDTFRSMRESTLSLLDKEDIQIGLFPFMRVNDELVDHELLYSTSVLYHSTRDPLEVDQMYKKFYSRQDDERRRPMVYNEATDHLYTPLIKKYLIDDLKSLALFPVWHQDELLGIVEVISTRTNAVNTTILRQMEQTLPMYREFLVYRLDHLRERMNRFVMERYTAIHPSVKWRFNEIAWQQISSELYGAADSALPQIRFDHLYPFYGAVDVRNSSLIRQEALNKDFNTQLQALEEVLKTFPGPDAAMQQKLAEVRDWRRRLGAAFLVEDETQLQEYIDASTEWLKEKKSEEPVLQAYLRAATDEQSRFHEAAIAYEQSLQQVNAAVKDVLEAGEKKLQEEIPHYFEHFKTDGWEYNLYAGQSLTPSVPLPADAFKVISRWQLDTMVDMALAAAAEKNNIPYPLDTTQLIFTHAGNIGIYFRADERRFDVDGAYSIRYEVIKKRIDKAHTAQDHERLTQPGTIAVVYGVQSVANVYEEHIRALVAAGRLLEGVEHLDLEELQGVAGLKALRVRVNPDAGSRTRKSALSIQQAGS